MSQQNTYMDWRKDKLPAFGADGTVVIEDGNQFSRVVPLEPSQTHVLATVLSRAFYDQANFRYIIPNEQSRLDLLTGLFRVAILASQLYGEIYTTQAVDGGALWIRSGTGLPLRQMMRGGFPSRHLHWKSSDLRRYMNSVAHLDEVHQRLVRGPHWHLLAVGMEPTKQKRKIGGTLLEPLLLRADSDALPCYVEVFNEKYLPFFKRHGFRIMGCGKIPRGGPDFWAMERTPQTISL